MRALVALASLVGVSVPAGCNVGRDFSEQMNQGGSSGTGTGGSDVGSSGSSIGSGGDGPAAGSGAGGDGLGGSSGDESGGGGVGGGQSGSDSGGGAGSPHCTDECSPSQSSCMSGSLRTCVEADGGCNEWSEPVSCGTGECGDAGSCLGCDDQCSGGDTTCAGGKLTTCDTDENGCRDWSPESDCPSGFCADSESCGTCDDTCSLGEYDCSGVDLYACEEDANGCLAFTEAVDSCTGDTPVCDAPAGACICTAAPEHCEDGGTALECVDGAVMTADCSGASPACEDGSGCVPCTEHSQCPSSACHLAGSKQGACFTSNQVTNVTTVTQLQNAVSGLSSSSEAVIRITSAGTYTLTQGLSMPSSAEVALIGAVDGIILAASYNPGDARNSIISAGSSTLYVANLDLTGNSNVSALQVSSSGSAWFDDLNVSGYYTSLNSAGLVHARRSWFRGNGLPMQIPGGSLFMENCVIGPNVNTSGSAVDGILMNTVISTTLDLRYVTIVGNTSALNCATATPPVGGIVRNSILASQAGNSVTGGTSGSNCSAIQFSNNAVDQSGYGTTIPWYNQAWFVSPTTGDFHLTATGESTIPTVAGYQSGDPPRDIDGDAHPAQDGYPGIDEP